MAKVGPLVNKQPPWRVPDARTLYGRTVSVMPLLAARHGHDLYRSFAGTDGEEALWTYMAYGPFATYSAFGTWIEDRAAGSDPRFVVLVPRDTGKPAGMASYMRIEAANGVCEIGNIWFAPSLQRTCAATEAICLMMRHVFDDLGYRRLEWKCDALNAASRRAAERLGFTFEGVFRQHMIIKGRNRDTAWYAIIDRDWPARRRRLEAWLAAANFDAQGRQLSALSTACLD
jgi:RimJ/RimL family protein N-acetyltransferase